MSTWAFCALGVPAQQGSKTANVITPKGGGRPRAIVRDANSKTLKPWRDIVNQAALGAGPKLAGPVAMVVVFTMPRPQSAPKKAIAPVKRPDLDKLVRAVWDSVTAAGLWGDDAQVVELHTQKVWTGYADLALPAPGVAVAATDESAGGNESGLWMAAGEAVNKVWKRYNNERETNG